jgi:hypothetical protein
MTTPMDITKLKIESNVDAQIDTLIKEGESRLIPQMIVERAGQHWKEHFNIPLGRANLQTLQEIVRERLEKLFNPMARVQKLYPNDPDEQKNALDHYQEFLKAECENYADWRDRQQGEYTWDGYFAENGVLVQL